MKLIDVAALRLDYSFRLNLEKKNIYIWNHMLLHYITSYIPQHSFFMMYILTNPSLRYRGDTQVWGHLSTGHIYFHKLLFGNSLWLSPCFICSQYPVSFIIIIIITAATIMTERVSNISISGRKCDNCFLSRDYDMGGCSQRNSLLTSSRAGRKPRLIITTPIQASVEMSCTFRHRTALRTLNQNYPYDLSSPTSD